jgi:hypothetical protein
MEHGISARQWLDFIDGTLAPAEKAKVAAHIRECKECEALGRGLADWHRRLTREAQEFTKKLGYSDADLDWLLKRTLDRLHRLEEKNQRSWRMIEALLLLRWLMTPIAGPGTARATIDLALGRAGIQPCARLNANQWSRFINTLTDAFGSICGLQGARLIGRAARSLNMDYGCF